MSSLCTKNHSYQLCDWRELYPNRNSQAPAKGQTCKQNFLRISRLLALRKGIFTAEVLSVEPHAAGWEQPAVLICFCPLASFLNQLKQIPLTIQMWESQLASPLSFCINLFFKLTQDLTVGTAGLLKLSWKPSKAEAVSWKSGHTDEKYNPRGHTGYPWKQRVYHSRGMPSRAYISQAVQVPRAPSVAFYCGTSATRFPVQSKSCSSVLGFGGTAWGCQQPALSATSVPQLHECEGHL